MRKLKTIDVFAFARVLGSSGIREDVTAFIQKLALQGETDTERIGIETVLMIMEALAAKKCESAIYEALGPIFEMDPKQVGELPPAEFFAGLKEIAEENDLKSFFGSVSSLLGKN
jgi:hypothetical protein